METSTPKPNVRITYDEMEAYLTLPELYEGDDDYTVASVMEALTKASVKTGIDQERILRMIDEEEYAIEVLIAKGTKAVDGIDGYYEYCFDTKLDKKPVIREDGTVDYWSIKAVEMVEAGQVIVKYHEPVQGSNGITVKGKPLIAKRGRAQIPLRGKGFVRSEDNSTYTAEFDGKVELQNDRLVVSSVYEIGGDADLTVGNIDFKGDVIVHGNVASGITIHATGTITIDGLAEACILLADKDITIRGGMMGDHRGRIQTKGALNAKFLEYCEIDTEGPINAASFYGCQVSSKDYITVAGNKSAIVGGEVYAVRGMEVDCVGNDSEIVTEVHAGVSRDVLIRINKLKNDIEQTEKDLTKIEDGLTRFEQISVANGADLKNDPRRVALLRTKIVKQADRVAFKEELGRLEKLVENSRGARIMVDHHVYPGVHVYVGDLKVFVKDPQFAVEFKEQNGKLQMLSLMD